MKIFTEAILTGFALYNIIYVVLPKKWLIVLKKLDRIACLVFSIGGLIIISLAIYRFHQAQVAPESLEQQRLNDLIYGKLWYVFWFIPIRILIATQIIWIPKLRRNKIARLTVSFLILVSIERLVWEIISYNRDYLPSSWSVNLSSLVLDWLASLAIFIVGIFVIHLIKEKIIGPRFRNDVRNITKQ